MLFQQKTRVKHRAAGRPTTAPVPALRCCAHLILENLGKNLSSAAARALLSNLVVAFVLAPGDAVGQEVGRYFC